VGSDEHEPGTLQSLFEGRAAPPLAQRLAEIAALWERARGRHVAALFGCSCGAPTAHVSAADFELDLIDFILARHAAASEAGTFLQGLERRDIAGHGRSLTRPQATTESSSNSESFATMLAVRWRWSPISRAPASPSRAKAAFMIALCSEFTFLSRFTEMAVSRR
jgi:hypothetical protein